MRAFFVFVFWRMLRRLEVLRATIALVAVMMSTLPAPSHAAEWADQFFGDEIVVTGTLGVDTTSVFRGIKSTKLNPSVFGNLIVERGDLYGGVYSNPSSIQGEVRPFVIGYANYAPRIGAFDVDVGGRYYAFIDSSDFSFDLDRDGVIDHTGRKGFFETFASVSRNFGDVQARTRVYYAPDVFAETGGSLYVNTRLKALLGNGFDVRADVGISEFEREQFNDEYVDYGIGIYKSLFGFSLSVRYSDTVGLAGSDDRVVSFSIERDFTLRAGNKRREYLKRKIRNYDWSGDKALFGYAR